MDKLTNCKSGKDKFAKENKPKSTYFRLQCAANVTNFFSDAYKKNTRVQKFLADGVQYGRSMIEMLGVLAIVGVLSVGGIAGYSKAMQKWKINKAVSEHSFMIFGLLDHIENIKQQTIHSGFADLAYSLDLVPNTWKKQSASFLIDDFNNNINLFNDKLYRYGQTTTVFAYEIYFGLDSRRTFDNQEHQMLCRELMRNLAKPLYEVVYSVYLWRGRTSSPNDLLFGSKYCTAGKKCLTDVTLTEIENLCRSCTVDNSGACSLVLYF